MKIQSQTPEAHVHRNQSLFQRILPTICCVSLIATHGISAELPTAASASAPLAVGDGSEDFELENFSGKAVKLSALTKGGPVVLVVLRGYPGYQCPLCTAQVAQYLGRANEFRDAKATVLLVYPGSAEGLKKHAAEFSRSQKLPPNFHLLLDPDYELTNAFHLRWDAPRETAYPSTFVIDQERKIRFAKVSKTHGDRASADEVLKSLSKQ
jgi:peroxiredoxin